MSDINVVGTNTATTEEIVSMDTTSEEITGETGESNFDISTQETVTSEEEINQNVEMVSEEALIEGTEDQSMTDSVTVEGEYTIPAFDEGYIDPGYIEEDIMYPGMETGMTEVKDPLLSSWPFVIGISAAVLVVSIVIGALLAKLKIKKGIDLYED